MRWRAPEGFEVEHIELDARKVLRVRHLGCLEGDCSSVPELERVLGRWGVRLADLVEEPDG